MTRAHCAPLGLLRLLLLGGFAPLLDLCGILAFWYRAERAIG